MVSSRMIVLNNTKSDISDSQLIAEIRQSRLNSIRSEDILVIRHSCHTDLPGGSERHPHSCREAEQPDRSVWLIILWEEEQDLYSWLTSCYEHNKQNCSLCFYKWTAV